MQYLYEIRNTINNKRYIGRTTDVKKRWYRHRYELNKGSHHSIYLQRAWDKYGEESFEFSIIDTRKTLEEIKTLEESYICDLNEDLYNVSSKSDGGDLISYHPNRDQIIEKMTQSMHDRYNNMSEEEKRQHSENLTGEKNPNYKHGKYTKAAREKRSKEWAKMTNKERYGGRVPWNKGKKLGPGKPWTEEEHKKHAEYNKNICGSKIVCEGILYINLQHAADVYEISKQGIKVRVESDSEQWNDFFYFDEDLHDENDYIKYINGKTDINEIRDMSYIYNNYSQERYLYCEGVIMTVKEAMYFYDIKSSNAIKYRCESKNDKWKEFFYLD